MKICTKCHKPKPIHEFSINKRTKDGHSTHCKKCVRRRYAQGAASSIKRDRYGLTDKQILSLSEENQWTLKSIKDGVYKEYFWDKSSFHISDIKAYKTLMRAIKGVKARGGNNKKAEVSVA